MTLNWIQRQESLQSTEQNFAKYNPRDALYSHFIFAVEISFYCISDDSHKWKNNYILKEKSWRFTSDLESLRISKPHFVVINLFAN